jgi:hypothetical protein
MPLIVVAVVPLAFAAAFVAVVAVGSLVRSSSPAVGHAEVLFSLPIGADGIGVEQVQGQPPWGPAAIMIDDEGWIWIADTVQRRIVAYDAAGTRLASFDLAGQATSIVDVDARGDEIAVLDVYPVPPTVLLINRRTGAVAEVVELPEAYSLAAGLSGITYGPAGELRAEFAGGERTARLADADRGAAAITAGWPTRYGVLIIDLDRPAGQLGHRAEIRYGNASFEIVSDAYLFVGPIDADAAGVLLSVDELSRDADGRIEVTQTVQRRDPDGRLLAYWPVPAVPDIDVAHPFAAEPSGDLLRLVPDLDRVEVVRISLGD